MYFCILEFLPLRVFCCDCVFCNICVVVWLKSHHCPPHGTPNKQKKQGKELKQRPEEASLGRERSVKQVDFKRGMKSEGVMDDESCELTEEDGLTFCRL